MIDLLLSIVFFILAIIIHAAYCRNKPTNVLYAKDFIIIALGLGLVFLYILNQLYIDSTRFVVSALTLYVLFIPVYLIIYVSMVLMSPSKSLLILLNTSIGLTAEDLFKNFKGDALIDSRFEELLASGCVEKKAERYLLTINGQIIFQALAAYQWLSGRQGEG